MGGPTGKTKNGILRLMYAAEQEGERTYVNQLAAQLKVKKNTISGHLLELKEQGYVREQMHGQWVLTPSGVMFARSLQPIPRGIEYRGYIAAGPAIPVSTEYLEEYFASEDLDPTYHFALRVRGDSMVSFNIQNDDLIIMREETNWLNVPAGAIVATYVPEGTDVESNDWLEKLTWKTIAAEEANVPSLNYVTLKKIDVGMLSFIQQGVEAQRFNIKLQGSRGSQHILAAQVGGILVERRHRYRW